MLKVYTTGEDWVVAASVKDAVDVWEETTGEIAKDYDLEFTELSSNFPLTIQNDDGSKTTKTCYEWVIECGRTYLAGLDY